MLGTPSASAAAEGVPSQRYSGTHKKNTGPQAREPTQIKQLTRVCCVLIAGLRNIGRSQWNFRVPGPPGTIHEHLPEQAKTPLLPPPFPLLPGLLSLAAVPWKFLFPLSFLYGLVSGPRFSLHQVLVFLPDWIRPPRGARWLGWADPTLKKILSRARAPNTSRLFVLAGFELGCSWHQRAGTGPNYNTTQPDDEKGARTTSES